MHKLKLLLISIFGFISLSFAADETLTITTYYPSPYGTYQQLTADQIAVGSGYRNPTYADGSLYVQGNVGIGTTSPQATLSVGSSDLLNFYKYADNTLAIQTTLDGQPLGTFGGDAQNRLVLQPLVGNVGIGTTVPGAKLDIVGPNINGAYLSEVLRFRSADYPNYYGSLYADMSGVSAGMSIGVNGTKAIYFALNGNVGIGTTSPVGKFQVQGGDSFFATSNFNTGTNAGGAFAITPTTNYTSLRQFKNGAHEWGDIILTDSGQSGGNVGIGTTAPYVKLHLYDWQPHAYLSIRLGTYDGFSDIYRSAAGNVNDYFSGTVSTGGGLVFEHRGTLQGIIMNTGGNTPIIFGTQSVERMRILGTGNVGIGITNPSYQLQLSTDSAAKPGTNTWTIASDIRIKKDIRPYTNGLSIIKKINPVWFKYNGKAGFPIDNQNHIGVIGQEIVKVAPYTVNTFRAKLNPDDKKETELLNFNSHALTFDLINAVKELSSELENLKTRLSRLEARK